VPLSWNLGTVTSWNPLGLSRPVMGLLYLLLYVDTKVFVQITFLKVLVSCFGPVIVLLCSVV